MGMFDYKNYTQQEAAKLVEDTSRLSAFTNAYNFFDFIPGADALNVLGQISGNLFPTSINVSIPEGWKELKPVDFGVSDSMVDKVGYFTIPSLYTGTAVPGPQAKIFGQYNEAEELVRINFRWCSKKQADAKSQQEVYAKFSGSIWLSNLQKLFKF